MNGAAPDPVWQWAAADPAGRVRVLFAGRGEAGSRAEVFERLTGDRSAVAWVRQIHGARVLEAAAAGERGEADALVTRDRGLVLSIVTADCVPVLLAARGEDCGGGGDCAGGGIAALHAGWRGIVAGVVGAAVGALGARGGMRAWVGPSIGACCYETAADVAEQIAAASAPGVMRPGPAGRPHVDLQAAVRHQLAAAGVEEVHTVAVCTRCTAELHSYRRDGARAGRNHAFIWRS